MMKYIKILILLLCAHMAGAQQIPLPKGFPTQKNLGWTEWAWIKSDSGQISAVRDTTLRPRFAGTRVLWQRPGIDTAEWYYTGVRWIKILKEGDGGNVNNRRSIDKAVLDSLQLVNDLPTTPNLGLLYQYGFDTAGTRNFVENKYVIAKVNGELRSLRSVDTSHIYRGIIDGVVGDFVYDPYDNTSPDDSVMVLITAGNRRLKRYYSDAVNVSWFGAEPGDGVDDWRAIQKAVDWVIAHNDKVKTVYFDSLGVYDISQPIVCYNWTGSDYTQFQINLVGAISGKMPLTTNMVQLSATFNDKFMIGIHKARAGSVKNILMIGNYSPGLTQKQAWESRRSRWVNASGRDDTYSPYSGIVIDPFRFDTTGINGGYPGMSGFYRGSTSNGGSSGITIENCYITNFVVGVMISPNTTTLNADNVSILDCRIETCMSVIAQGQAQTKGNYVKNLVTWGITHTVIDCANYGLRDGYPPIVDGVNVANTCHQIIDQRSNTAIPVVITNVFAEGLFKLGRVLSPRVPLFSNSEYRFVQILNANVGDPDRMLVASNASFDGVNLTVFSSANGADSARINFSNEAFTFRNCTFNAPPITAETADILLDQRSVFFNCRGVLYQTFGNVWGQTNDINTSTRNTPLSGLEFETTAGSSQATNKFRFSDPLDVMISIGDRNVIVDTVTRTAKIVMSGLTGVVQRGDYIMSTFSSATKDTTLYGDVDKNPCIGRVSVVTADTIYVTNVPVSVRLTGTRSLYMNYYRRLGAMFTGDFVSGQDTIRNVEVYKSIWPVAGDRLESPSSTTGLIAGVYVTSVDQANAKIVVSRAFTASASHVDFWQGNPKVTVTAFNSPSNVAGTVFQFKGAEWNIISNSAQDSIGHKYLILRSGPFNSTLHPQKSIKVFPNGDLSALNVSTKNVFVSDANYTVLNTDYAITYNSATATRTITLPAVATNTNRILIIHNPTAQSLTTSLAIRQNSTTTYTSIAAGTSSYIACDGVEWRDIFRSGGSGGSSDSTILSPPLYAIDGGSNADTIRLGGLTTYGTAGQMVRTNSGATGWEYFTPDFATQSALNDTAAAIRAAAGAYSGTGTANRLTKWTGSTSFGNSLIQDDGTNVAVNGTPGATYKFDVQGGNSRIAITNGGTTIGDITTSGASNNILVNIARTASSGTNTLTLGNLSLANNIGTGANSITTGGAGHSLAFSVAGSQRAMFGTGGVFQINSTAVTSDIAQRRFHVNGSIGANKDSVTTIPSMSTHFLLVMDTAAAPELGKFKKILPANLGVPTLYSADGALAGNRVVSGGGFSLELGASGSSLSALTLRSAENINLIGSVNISPTSIATDADYIVLVGTTIINLPEITANRSVALPAATAGKVFIIWNQNSSGFAWSFGGGGATVIDAAGSSITTLSNDSVYMLLGTGTDFLKIN